MPIGFGPAALGPTRNGLPLRKRFLFQRALWVFVATGGTVPVSDEVAQGPEALREPRGALWLLAEVEAHWKNNAASEGNERTVASRVGEGRGIRVPTRPGGISTIQIYPGEKPLDPLTLLAGAPPRE